VKRARPDAGTNGERVKTNARMMTDEESTHDGGGGGEGGGGNQALDAANRHARSLSAFCRSINASCIL